MKKIALFLSVMMICSITSAQFAGEYVRPATGTAVPDGIQASLNQHSFLRTYPAVNAQTRQGNSSVVAPHADNVALDLAGKKYSMTKDEKASGHAPLTRAGESVSTIMPSSIDSVPAMRQEHRSLLRKLLTENRQEIEMFVKDQSDYYRFNKNIPHGRGPAHYTTGRKSTA